MGWRHERWIGVSAALNGVLSFYWHRNNIYADEMDGAISEASKCRFIPHQTSLNQSNAIGPFSTQIFQNFQLSLAAKAAVIWMPWNVGAFSMKV